VAYQIDSDRIGLDQVGFRIESTDLVPSRTVLLEGLDGNLASLGDHGAETLADLRYELKNKKRLAALSEATGIDADYLVLLRREIESWFPKPFPLKDFDWLPADELAKLSEQGIPNTAALYDATSDEASRAGLAESAGIDSGVLDSLSRLADLTRVQWVSPTAARMLAETGCDGAADLAAADPDVLCVALERVNEGDRFFKGKIGLRDVKRLVHSAGYIAGSAAW
jgi:hypothetical protein